MRDGSLENDFAGCIQLPFGNIGDNIGDLMTSVLSDLETNSSDLEWFNECVILAPKNVIVDVLNNLFLERPCPAESTTFMSMDMIPNSDDAVNYPIEFYKQFSTARITSTPFISKKTFGAQVMLLRNIAALKLCNGTQVVIKQMKSSGQLSEMA